MAFVKFTLLSPKFSMHHEIFINSNYVIAVGYFGKYTEIHLAAPGDKDSAKVFVITEAMEDVIKELETALTNKKGSG